MSSRLLQSVDKGMSSEPGTGRGARVRTEPGQNEKGYEGSWELSYFEPDGGLAAGRVFRGGFEKIGQIYHGKWETDGATLDGFGFEDGGSLYMRYGSR